jgi:hypothetical protein
MIISVLTEMISSFKNGLTVVEIIEFTTKERKGKKKAKGFKFIFASIYKSNIY